LGEAYENGKGAPEDDARRCGTGKLRTRANPASGKLFGRSIPGGVEKNIEAVGCYRKSAKSGSPDAMFNLGPCYYDGDGLLENPTLAYSWFLAAQDAGRSPHRNR
jgi:TPR repeat protein